MNLYELAHHPEAWNSADYCKEGTEHWTDSNNTTDDQFELLNFQQNSANSVSCHTDENEFRMHLLFVHWTTLENES